MSQDAGYREVCVCEPSYVEMGQSGRKKSDLSQGHKTA